MADTLAEKRLEEFLKQAPDASQKLPRKFKIARTSRLLSWVPASDPLNL